MSRIDVHREYLLERFVHPLQAIAFGVIECGITGSNLTQLTRLRERPTCNFFRDH